MIDEPTGRDSRPAMPERDLLPEKIHFKPGDIS